MGATVAVTTDARAGRRPAGWRPDRVTVSLFSLALFLILLAIMAGQLGLQASSGGAPRAMVVRKLYVTRVVETVIGSTTGGTSVSQSVSSSGSAMPAAPTTRTSGG